MRERGWKEFTVYAAVLAAVADRRRHRQLRRRGRVPRRGADRVRARRRSTRWPASIPRPRRRYTEVGEVDRKLTYAGNEAARRYLDGEIDRAAAVDWLERWALYAAPARRAADPLLRPVPELRHQLQPGQGPGPRLRRIARRHRRRPRRPLARVREAALLAALAVGIAVGNRRSPDTSDRCRRCPRFVPRRRISRPAGRPTFVLIHRSLASE